MSDSHDPIRQILAELLGVDVDEVRPAALLVDDLKADSLNMVELTIVVEDALGFWIEEEELAALKTVQDLFDLADRKLAGRVQ